MQEGGKVMMTSVQQQRPPSPPTSVTVARGVGLDSPIPPHASVSTAARISRMEFQGPFWCEDVHARPGIFPLSCRCKMRQVVLFRSIMRFEEPRRIRMSS